LSLAAGFRRSGFELSTTTGFSYRQASKVSSVSNVFRPITIASTVAMNSLVTF
jgi:hypothetical protein